MWLVAPEMSPMWLVTLYLCPLCLAAPDLHPLCLVLCPVDGCSCPVVGCSALWMVVPNLCPLWLDAPALWLVVPYLCPLWLVVPAAAVAASLWNERKDGVRHVGHEVGVVVLEHASPVEGGRLPGPDAQH